MCISPKSICVCVLVTQSCPILCSPWTIVHQAPLSMGLSRQEYWNGVATPFSKGSSQPRDGIRVPCTADRLLIIWATIVQLSCELANLKFMGSPGGSDSKKSACNAGDTEDSSSVRKIPWRRKWQPTLVFLPGQSHGQRSLEGYSPWVTKSWTRLRD